MFIAIVQKASGNMTHGREQKGDHDHDDHLGEEGKVEGEEGEVEEGRQDCQHGHLSSKYEPML